MLELLQTGKALYVLAAIGIIGVFSKLVTRNLYRGLIRETDNMAMTKNRNLKALKQRLDNACRLNQNIVNTEAYLERQMYGFRFMKISLDGWNNMSLQMTLLGILAGGGAAFASYWYRLDSYYIVLYGAAGAFCGLFLAFLESSFNIGLKQQRLANALLEYVDNSVFVRAARDSAAAQDNIRHLPVRDLDKGVMRDSSDERDRLIRENDLRDGIIREGTKPSPKDRKTSSALESGASRGERQVDKPAGLRRLKAEKMNQAKKAGDLKSGETKTEGEAAASQGPAILDGLTLLKGAGVKPQGQETGSGNQALKDGDSLKRSLEQIAASRESSKKDGSGQSKELNQEEMKMLGELICQYFNSN